MNGETYILQVALVGIFVVVVVLVAMIYFVKAQALLLRLIDKTPAPVAPVAQPLDSKDQKQQEQLQEHLNEELSKEEIAAISAVIFMMIGRPVRITSINVIPPQIK